MASQETTTSTDAQAGLAAGDRVWIAIAVMLVLAGIAGRVHNAIYFDSLLEPDGNGHALHVLAWYEGRLPDPRAWAGFHPPFYYLLGAGIWHLLPESVPVHMTLRVFSALLGLATILLVWRALRDHFAPADAAVLAAFAWCLPFVTMVTSAIGNETLGALFATLVLVRMMKLPQDDTRLARHAVVTGVLAGIGLLVKSSGLVVLGAVGLTYLIRLRNDPTRALRVGAITGTIAIAIAAPHYVRVAAVSDGSILSAFSAAAVSPEVRAVMDAQPPGERSVADYLSLPAATLLDPAYNAPGLTRSVPGLLYVSTWADGHGSFFPIDEFSEVSSVQIAMVFAGLLPTALLLLGAVRVMRRPEASSAWLCPLILLGALAIAFLGYSWRYPTYAAVKAQYMLPALLPLTLLTATGLESAKPALRSVLRGALVLIAAGFIAATWWGWWFEQ